MKMIGVWKLTTFGGGLNLRNNINCGAFDLEEK